jgi:hypothetical protein
MIDEIINQIKTLVMKLKLMCQISFTEFGSFTVGESGGATIKFVPKQQMIERNGI